MDSFRSIWYTVSTMPTRKFFKPKAKRPSAPRAPRRKVTLPADVSDALALARRQLEALPDAWGVSTKKHSDAGTIMTALQILMMVAKEDSEAILAKRSDLAGWMVSIVKRVATVLGATFTIETTDGHLTLRVEEVEKNAQPIVLDLDARIPTTASNRPGGPPTTLN